MQEWDFNELAGRIDGLCRVLLFLVDDADKAGLIAGEEFTERLRGFAAILDFDQPHLEASKRTMLELAGRIDTAHNQRQ